MTLRTYLRSTHPALLAFDLVRVFGLFCAPLVGLVLFRWLASTDGVLAPFHRRLWYDAAYAGSFYRWFVAATFLLTAAWVLSSVRTFMRFTLTRTGREVQRRDPEAEKMPLPRWPYARDSFALVLGELQDRDGSRVPSERSPGLKPRWLVLPELALYTGVFVTGGIGSGKTSAVAYPALRQLLGFRRPVRVRRIDRSIGEEPWSFSGLVLDEKGDFTRAAAQYAEEWGRAADIIRIAPGGEWIWNVIYNPNLPTWAVAYQLGWILKNFNRGASGGDPFWENAPKELVTEYLGLLDDAEGYYTLFDYLETLIDDAKQNALHKKALARHADDPDKVEEILRRWKSIERRRNEMSVSLRGALEACAKAGIDMFRFPELRRTFCPTREEYFEHDDAAGVMRPRANVFTGFDQVLDYGKIVGLEMPKQIYFDAAVFVQVSLKSQWQDAVLRREGIGSDGKLLLPPRFGEKIGYCPTFLFADEAQISATPKDAEFKAVCRSKRASMWELTQSHGSIRGAFGAQKAADANTYFQNSMTHIYLRQSDVDSMKTIQDEAGKKLVQRTSLAITEGGNSSELSYVQGGIVHQGIGVSATKTVATEEKPFIEIEELKALPNNVAVVLASNGDRTLSASITYLRPLWVFRKHPHLPIETPWLDWPEDLRASYDLDNIPQELNWEGWEMTDPLEETAVVAADERLGRFVQRPSRASHPPAPPTAAPVASPADEVTAPPNLLPPVAGELPRPTPALVAAPAPAAAADAPEPKPRRPYPSVSVDDQPVPPGDLAIATARIQAGDVDRDGDPFAGLPDDEL
ncbi:MAG TPA: TraM recognition domain-containing protein [Polyangia bacterium]|nr:TraM recognition domain-containing protein [Polyangia bacterium]